MANIETLETLFGGKAAIRVLLYLENYGTGYASQIARTYGMPVSEIQKQLQKFEEAGIIVSQTVGTSRVFGWNNRDQGLNGLKILLRDTLDFGISEPLREKYFTQRRRPRRKGKPL